MARTSRMSRSQVTPRREYGFDKMKSVGDTKRVSIPPSDPVAGTRALTAAYAFARRYNEKVKRKSERIRFAGRLSPTGKVMVIHRVA